MTPGGWLIMIVSCGTVIFVTAFCLQKVLKLPPSEVEAHLKAPLEIDTGDTRDAD